MLNPNRRYFSVQSAWIRHTQHQQREVDGGLRTADSDKHNQPQQNNADGCVTRTALPAGAYGWQRCNVVLCACCLLLTWYKSGLCAHESLGEKTDSILPVCTYKGRPLVLKPGKSFLHSRRKKTR